MATYSELFYDFRQLTDETDLTFESDADVKRALNYGVNKFYQTIQGIDPDQLISEVSINPLSKNFYDLADPVTNPVAIFGKTVKPTGIPPARRIVKLYTSIAQSGLGSTILWSSAKSYDEILRLRSVWTGALLWYGDPRYILMGNVLQFPFGCTVPITVVYQIAFAGFGTDPNEYVDDFGGYGDLITLYALQRYAMRDGQMSQQIASQIKLRENDLSVLLIQGKDFDNGGSVNIMP